MHLQRLKAFHVLLLCFFVGFFLTACGGGGSGGSATSVAPQGTLSTSLTDSSTDEYQAVYVTIARVEVHHDGGGAWKTVASPGKTYNLLELVNGVRETLDIVPLATGHYTQMRLIVGNTPGPGLNMFSRQHPYANYLVNLQDEVHQLKVPSGTNTGLKIVNGFDINENQTTELLLDFDAMRSVVKAGASGKYLLKPTIKVLDTVNQAIVSGMVTDADTAPPLLLGGSLVTAQVPTPASADAKDQIVIEAGTLTNDNGEYALFLSPGDYNLVAARAGYLPNCTAVTLLTDSTTTVDIVLPAAAATPGTITGTVTIANATAEQYVTIDFRQEVTCVDSTTATPITVKSVNIANGGVYSVNLPPGDYQVVASTFNESTQTADVNLASAATTPLDISF